MKQNIQLDVQSPAGSTHILVQPDQQSENLADLLRRHELPLNTRCGEIGLCDGCMIQLLRGQLHNITTNQTISITDKPITLRACEHHPVGDKSIHIRIPTRSLLAYHPQVVSDFKLNVSAAFDPICPTGKCTTDKPLGVAIDIGTTTVAALLVDLANGNIIARASNFNQQMHFGDNVLTRINLCQTNPKMVRQLQHAIIRKTIVPLLHDILAQANAITDQLTCATIAGNTTMLHLLAGIDPTPLGTVPFEPAFLDHRILNAADLFLEFDAPVHLLPGAAAYIGSDLCAGALSSGLIYDTGPSLLVDVGTNGEIILKDNNTMLGCATAAGPAFEGAGLLHGLRAGDGAISHINFTNNSLNAQIKIIGDDDNPDIKPTGLCGTAYIDFLAQARQINLINSNGRFTPKHLNNADQRTFKRDEHGLAFRVAYGQGNTDIVITESDIALLLQAKAAVGAGIRTLLQCADISPDQLKTLYLAGGFGMYMNVANAIASSLLPGIAPQQVQLVGNTSLGGAYLALIDKSTLAACASLTNSLDVIELNLQPDFETTFIDELSLP